MLPHSSQDREEGTILLLLCLLPMCGIGVSEVSKLAMGIQLVKCGSRIQRKQFVFSACCT